MSSITNGNPPYQGQTMQGAGANAPTLPTGVTISPGGPGQDPAGTIEIGSGYQGGGGGLKGIDATAAQLQQQQQQNQAGGSTTNTPMAQQDALQQAITQLTSLGMNLADATTIANQEWAWHVQGYSDQSIADLVLTTPLFNQYFPEIQARQKAGLPPITAAWILNYKDTIAQYGNQYGIPKQFTDQFLSDWITKDVSPAEVGQRLQDYAQAAYASNPAVVNQLQQLYGVTPGELVAFFADPTTALPIISQRFQAAQIAGQSQIAGTGQLTQDQAQMLAQQGVTQAQAQSGFQQLGLESQLFQALPGQTGQPGIDMGTQLGAQFMGNAADVRTIQLEALRRQAAFQGGGQFAGSNKGLTGLGTEQGAQA